MFNEPQFDGEAHAISKEYGAIANLVPEEDRSSFLEVVDLQLITYAKYLAENDKEKVIEYLLEIFRRQVRHFSTDENYQLIYRPPWLVGALAQRGTIVLKFKRAHRDSLQ